MRSVIIDDLYPRPQWSWLQELVGQVDGSAVARCPAEHRVRGEDAQWPPRRLSQNIR